MNLQLQPLRRLSLPPRVPSVSWLRLTMPPLHVPLPPGPLRPGGFSPRLSCLSTCCFSPYHVCPRVLLPLCPCFSHRHLCLLSRLYYTDLYLRQVRPRPSSIDWTSEPALADGARGVMLPLPRPTPDISGDTARIDGAWVWGSDAYAGGPFSISWAYRRACTSTHETYCDKFKTPRSATYHHG